MRPGPTDDPDQPSSLCWACVLQLGDAVQRPELLTNDVIADLAEAHADAVEIRRRDDTPRDVVKFKWRWIRD